MKIRKDHKWYGFTHQLNREMDWAEDSGRMMSREEKMYCKLNANYWDILSIPPTDAEITMILRLAANCIEKLK